MQPPGECKLPWFLVVVEHHFTLGSAQVVVTLVSPNSRGDFRITRTKLGS